MLKPLLIAGLLVMASGVAQADKAFADRPEKVVRIMNLGDFHAWTDDTLGPMPSVPGGGKMTNGGKR